MAELLILIALGLLFAWFVWALVLHDDGRGIK